MSAAAPSLPLPGRTATVAQRKLALGYSRAFGVGTGLFLLLWSPMNLTRWAGASSGSIRRKPRMTNHMQPRRRDDRRQPAEQREWVHVDGYGAVTECPLESDAHEAVWETELGLVRLFDLPQIPPRPLHLAVHPDAAARPAVRVVADHIADVVSRPRSAAPSFSR